MMPKMDGRELLRTLRRGDNWIPVILLTAKAGQEQLVETVDVLPTIAAELGAVLHERVDGRPLFAAASRRDRARKLLFRVPIAEERMGIPNTRIELPAELPGRVATAERVRRWMNDDRRARDRLIDPAGADHQHQRAALRGVRQVLRQRGEERVAAGGHEGGDVGAHPHLGRAVDRESTREQQREPAGSTGPPATAHPTRLTALRASSRRS